jgi:hypothetical protein
MEIGKTKALFCYRNRQLDIQDIRFIQEVIARDYPRGRSHIARCLCEAWQWVQPNGKIKEFAARDLLLRLEEQEFIALPPRLRTKINRKKDYEQIPFFQQESLEGSIQQFEPPEIEVLGPRDGYLWDYLIHHYHYLGRPPLVGEHVRHLVRIRGQEVACLAWASAAWKIKSRDQFIGWDESSKRKNLYLLANNTRFLILDWIRIKHLASKILALSLRRLSADWQQRYGHPIVLAETFVDLSRFAGTCYQAANWIYVGQTKGSAKRGNAYHYHGQPKALYLYPLHRHFRKVLRDDRS